MEDKRLIDGSMALKEKQHRVITIEATEKPQNVKLRVAAYARVSSASDDQLNSFAAQNRYYTTLISGRENWNLVDIYADEGVTGTSAEKRADFQRLLADCRRGQIDRVLVKSISRFARNTKECLEAIRELKALGIGVCFEKESIDTSTMSGEMMTALFASFAQAESESISGNMRWSIQKRMESGTFVPSSQPFGYEIINKEIAINLSQARFVCEIFSAYLCGWNTREIADRLNSLQPSHPELCGRTWTYKAIARILKNEKYIGDSLWQKTYRTQTLPRKELPNRGACGQYYAANTHPAIIEKSIYQKAQELRTQRYRMKPSVLEGDSPLQSTVICEHCGGFLRRKEVNSRIYRSCRKHDLDQRACSLTPIPDSEIEQAFLRLYYKLKHNGEPILFQMLSNLQTVRNRRMLWSLDVIQLNKEISNLTSQNQMLATLKQQGLIDPDIFIAQSNELAEQLRTAKLQKERLMDTDGDETIAQTRELMEILNAGPEFLDSFDEELFGELVDKIIVESNERLRFRLINGLELAESIERTVR